MQIYEQGALAPPVVFATQANYVAALALAYAAPPGYWNVTVYGIAEKMYHMVTRDVMPHKVPYQLLAAWAKTARDHVKNINRAIPRLGTDAPRGGAGGIPTYDQFVWETGEPE
jgi:hypothetical protein